MLNSADAVEAEEAEQNQTPSKPSLLTRLILWLVVMSMSFLFVSMTLVTSSVQERNATLQAELTSLEEQVAVTPEPDPQEEALTEQLSQVRSQVNILNTVGNTLTSGYVDWRGAAAQISAYDGTQIAMTGLVQTDNRLVITGRAKDEHSVIDYVHHLETYPNFERIIVQSISLKTITENEIEYKLAEFSIMVELQVGQS